MSDHLLLAQSTKSRYFSLLFIGIVLLRIVPHLANAIPLFALLTIYTVSFRLPKSQVTVITLLAILLSDILLGAIYGYPIVGSYSWFTYSGFALVIASHYRLFQLPVSLCVNTGITTILFWLWTNLGVWLFAKLYQLDSHGLWQCYIMALPFLKRALLINGLGILSFIIINLCCLNTSKRNSKDNIIYQGASR